MKNNTRSKIGKRQSNPGYRTPSFWRVYSAENFKKNKIKTRFLKRVF